MSSNPPVSVAAVPQPAMPAMPVQAAQATPSPPAPAPKAVTLADIFADKPEGDAPADDPSKPVDTLDGLTQRYGLTAEQIYALKVPMPSGAEPITLGTMKDRVSDLVEFEQREMQFDQRRIKAEGELLRAQSEMRELIASLPAESIKPEIVKKIRAQHETMMTRERELTAEHIPEWQDERIRAADIQGMIEHLGDYGFPESFITTIVDHRAIKYIRDNYLRDQRIKKALANVKEPQMRGQRPSGKGRPVASPKTPPPSNRRAGMQPDPRARIMSVLNKSE